MGEKPTYAELQQRVLELEKTGESLRGSEVSYRELFASNPHPMWIYDLESLAFLDVNNAAIEHYGYSREEFLSMTIKDIRPPEDIARLLDNVDVVDGGLDKAGTWRHIKKNGDVIYVEITSHVIQFGQRRAELVLASDITDRKIAEEILRSYEQIISATNDLMSFVDHKYVYRSVNKAYLTAHAKKLEEIVGFPVEHLMGAEAFQNVAKGYLDRALGGQKVQYQSWFEYAGIGRRFMDVAYHPLKNQQGNIIGVVVSAHDLTERKQTEEGFKESQRQLITLMSNLPGMAYRCKNDSDWTMEFVSDGCYPLTGYQPHDLVGNALISYAEIIHPDDRRMVEGGVQDAVNEKRSFQLIYRIHTADQEEKWVWEKGRSVLESDGKIVALEGFITDITERKLAEEEGEKLREQLYQSQKMESVGRLAGGVAHDFNNMLGVILGSTELLFMGMDKEDPRYAELQEIYNAARRSAELTRQLLAFARKQNMAPKVLDFNDTLEGMLKMLRRLIGEDIDLVWKPHALIWPVKIDPAQVDQILANLCVNARDAIFGTGKVTIETENVTFDEAYCKTHPGSVPGQYVMLAVSDDGCGMDKETLNNLFEPFFTTKEFGEGTGLGLATVYGIVKQNEGFINVYSEPGQGTTFKIYLPRTQPAADAIRETAAETIAEGAETVLLVEDEESILKLGKTVLERFGYEVLAAYKPKEALVIVERFEGPIHLLVTDVVMPEMNGKELAARVEKIKPDIRVLYMSGYAGDVIMNHGILEGNVNFLQKPFSINTLAVKVREVLDQPGK